MGVDRIREGGELGAREVVAVHGDEGSNGDGSAARFQMGVVGINAIGNGAGESGFAWRFFSGG